MEVKADFKWIDDAGGMDDDLVHLSGRVSERYEHMLVLDLKRATKVPPRAQEQRNSVEHLMLGVVVRVVTWCNYDVGRTTRSESVFEGFRNANELAASMRADLIEFPEPPANFTRLPLLMGVRMPPLMTHRYFAEAAEFWVIGAPSAIGACAEAMEKKATTSERRGNT